LEGKKKKHKVFVHERNPNYPSKEYGHFVRKVVLQYYNKKILDTLKRMFIDHGVDGLMSLLLELNSVITNALARLELYNNYDRNFENMEGGWTNKSFQVH
jgi:hypothetical protein